MQCQPWSHSICRRGSELGRGAVCDMVGRWWDLWSTQDDCKEGDASPYAQGMEHQKAKQHPASQTSLAPNGATCIALNNRHWCFTEPNGGHLKALLCPNAPVSPAG